MVGTANKKLAAAGLLDKMAFQTEVRVAVDQQLGIDRAVRVMTGGATFAHSFMFEHKRALLRGMTTQAHFIFREQRSAAAGQNGTFVRVMAVGTGHPAFGHRMMIGQVELPAHVGVAGVSDRFLRARRLHREVRAVTARLRAAGGERVRRLGISARFRVRAARAVAGFAPGVQRVDRKSTRLNSSHWHVSRMPSSA